MRGPVTRSRQRAGALVAIQDLTEREREVLSHIAKGLSNGEIAAAGDASARSGAP